ncbi:MAG: sortase [Candidatus Nealsonbacteria bacterium]
MRIRSFSKEQFLSFLQVFIFFFAVIVLVSDFGAIKGIFNDKIFYSKNETPIQEEIILTQLLDNSIEIPKIQITAPLVFIDSVEKSIFSGALDRGVVHYPGSALPGEDGQIIFLGHSAPAGWPKIKHDWVFSNLNNLIAGDEINFYFNNKKYTYRVAEKVILNKGEDLPAITANGLILLTCWPSGVDQRRMAVIAH